MARAIVTVHPRDREFGNGATAGAGSGDWFFSMSVHKPVYPPTLAAAVKFALTRGVAFH
jgi:hypothetical protein